MSCRRQGILTQEPAPDPKCKLNVTSFFTFPHPLDCLICAKDIMIIVLLKMMGGMGRLGVVYLCGGLGGGIGSRYHIFSIFCSVFVLLLIVLSWLVHDNCCVCFIDTTISKTISKVRFLITNLWIWTPDINVHNPMYLVSLPFCCIWPILLCFSYLGSLLSILPYQVT